MSMQKQSLNAKREIKVRSWNKSVKKFLHFSNPIIIFDNPDRYGMFLPVVEGKVYLSSYEDMLSTGLKDSENQEEYFGDLIQECDGTIRQVIDGLSAVLFVASGVRTKYFWDLLPHKIIGNIYENPELLVANT
jgi:hypothetical protein